MKKYVILISSTISICFLFTNTYAQVDKLICTNKSTGAISFISRVQESGVVLITITDPISKKEKTFYERDTKPDLLIGEEHEVFRATDGKSVGKTKKIDKKTYERTFSNGSKVSYVCEKS